MKESIRKSLNKRIIRSVLFLLLMIFLSVIFIPSEVFAETDGEIVQNDGKISEKTELESLAENKGAVAVSVGNTQNSKQFDCKDKGYRLIFPSDAVFSSNPGDYDAKVTAGGCVIQVTKEWSPYLNPTEEMTKGIDQLIPDFKWSDGKDQYIGYYQSRFILNKDWQKNNGVNVSEVQDITAGGCSGKMYSAVIKNVPGDIFNAYTYVYLKMNDHFFLRIVAKYRSGSENPADNTTQINMIKNIASSLKSIKTSSSGSEPVPDYKPERKAAWSNETQQLYDRIKNIGTSASKDSLLWGIYTDDIKNQGIKKTIPDMEKKLNYKFSVVLGYVHYIENFPTEFMNKAYEEGKIVELTYQLTDSNNLKLFSDSISMRLYRKDPAVVERIREFARDAKSWGHPFLFRYGNEMNSDWTSYSGVVNMADPDIFIANWRTIYNIFTEEGVDNCIWIYNPNDRNAPPNEWNGAQNYYPGNEYVDMIGVTGYNNGTYFYSRWLETWRGFTEIYDEIQDYYGKYFSEFPWIITEFASSSVGGDKPAWIRSMFDNIGKYKNIKAAVWFSSADYDENGVAARKYWLDETPSTVMAFRHGFTGAPDFRDLDRVPWALDAICEVTDAGYFKGTSDTTFSPFVDMSRAMIFTVIARIAGVDTSTGSEWYEAGMEWAVKQGITDGTKPFSSVTREQIVTMLYRYKTGDILDIYNVGSGEDQNIDTGSLEKFGDKDEISDWAQKSMIWAVENGVVVGDDQNLINPKQMATRSQVAVLISRFVKL